MDEFLQTMNRDVERIEIELRDLPDMLADVELAAANDRRRLDELKESLEISETNAALRAQADGKDADTRKMQRNASVWQDGEVKRWGDEICKVQQSLDEATVKADMLRRKYGALCHISSLKAAQLNIMGTVHPF